MNEHFATILQQIDQGNYITILAGVLRLIAQGLFLFVIIPLQYIQSRIYNGLYPLRRQLLISGIALSISNVLTLYFLKDNFEINSSFQREFLSVVNAFVFLIVALVKYRIYTFQYSDSNIETHRLLEVSENKQKKGGVKK